MSGVPTGDRGVRTEGDDVGVEDEACARVSGLFDLERLDDDTFCAPTRGTGPARFPGMRLFGARWPARPCGRRRARSTPTTP